MGSSELAATSPAASALDDARGHAATFPRAWLPDESPDWSAIDREITCPRCAYDLRTLREPRCPECGLQFDWHDIFDALFTISPWLFEHQWRRKPFRAYCWTLFTSLHPARFWRKLPLHLRVRPRALIVQLFAAALGGVGLYIAVLLGALFLTHLWEVVGPIPSPFRRTPGTLQSDMIRIFSSLLVLPGEWSFRLQSIISGMIFLAICSATLVSLRQTLARCRVRSDQLLRVVSTCALGWFAIAACCGAAVTAAQIADIFAGGFFLGGGGVPSVFVWWLSAERCLLLAFPFWWLSLTYALGRYLRLPRAWFIALLTSIVALLAMITGPIFWFAFVVRRF